MNGFDINTLLNGKVLPPLPPFPKGIDPVIEKGDAFPDAEGIYGFAADEVQHTVFGTPMVMPLKIKLPEDSEWWLLPTECLITIGGKNILAKRNVAKGKLRGSIKERWSQDDYTISIQGLFTVKDSFVYPTSDVERLRSFCEAKKPIDVQCPVLGILGISRMVIESYEIPHTKGEENQNWSISAMSDDDWNLFISIDDSSNVL